MRKLFRLLMTQLNAQYGISAARNAMKTDRKARWKGIGLGFALVLSFGVLLGLYTLLLLNVYRGAGAIGSPQIILTMGALTSGTLILVFGLFSIISTLFLAKDSEFLASLPVPQQTVFLSKFLLVLVSEYPFAFGLMLPPVFIYGIGEGKGPLYWLVALLGILLLPLIPLVVSAFFALLLMKAVSHVRHRNALVLAGSSVLLIGFLVGQFWLTSRIPEDEQAFLAALLQTANGIVEFMGRVFPPSIWLTKALSLQGWDAVANFLVLLAVSAIGCAVAAFLASFIYQRGATAQLETGLRQGKTRLRYRTASPVRVMFTLEWKTLLRTPLYAMNSLVMIFMAPLLLALPLFGGNLANDPELKMLYDLIRDANSAGAVMLVLSGIITMMTLINPAVSTSLSREGRCFWILKNIPVPPVTQAYGKFWAGWSISFLGALLAVVAAVFSFGIPFWMGLMIFILCALALIPICAAGLCIDLLRPKLVWNNAQEAIKQNLNVILAMLSGIAMVAILGGIGFVFLQLWTEPVLVFAALTILLMVLAVGSLYGLARLSRQAWNRLGS